jgi:hypothetical protein
MLSVIGVGFPRTGTMSLKLALEELGFGPCYHMIEVFDRLDDIPLWLQAASGQTAWERIFSGFRSTSDAPACCFWQELVAEYPDAKVILTERDADDWYESFEETVYPVICSGVHSPDAGHRALQEMARELVLDLLLQGRFEDRARAIEIYQAHNRAVREHVDPDRLLILRLGEGWQPLCEFLQKEVPSVPFPHTNTRMEFRERFLATSERT